MIILSEHGIENFKNIQPRTESIVPASGVGNGSNLKIYIKRMGRSLGRAADARPRSAVSVMGSGMARKNARRMRRLIVCSRQPSKQAGSDVITVGPWLS